MNNTFTVSEGSFDVIGITTRTCNALEMQGKGTIASQQQSDLSQRYADQSHQVEAVFYAPEGDVMELHDTAQYQLQILDGDKTIQDEHVTVHYIILMTPTADRWVVRQLQAVPQF